VAEFTDDCPKRGPGLSHIQDGRRRPNGSCVYCNVALPFRPPPWEVYDVTPPPPVPPPFDVAGRLRALGMVAPEPEPAEPEPDMPVEPKAITGDGPQGPTYGIGRGDHLSERLRHKLDFVKFIDERVLP
jgi:hypothetical protein